MIRSMTFYVALAALALSANGASAAHFASGQSARVHVPKSKPIHINSFQWGVGRTISSPTGGSADRAGKVSIGEISVKGGKKHK
jgi:hypothetical protein